MAYPNPKIYHLAYRIDLRGKVSALCYKRPRAINLSQASWTLVDEEVTCKKCLKIIGSRDGK